MGNTVNITIKDIKIEFGSSIADQGNAAFAINSGHVMLNLAGTNTLISGIDRAGLEVEATKGVTISGSGTLYAKNYGGRAAGIGGSVNNGAGDIIISGGIINASSGEDIPGSGNGAGIGGGGNDGGDGGNIIISGGFITANSNIGAGIGGGEDGAGGNIIISGGFITARSGDGAGIGGGEDGAGGNIIISGGTIEAISSGGAGIGGGQKGAGGNIEISGGSIEASSNGGTGIGGGNSGAGGNIKISSGSITALSATGAGIGGGANNGAGGDIKISGGFITASSELAAGIGGGDDGVGGDVKIFGKAEVSAESKYARDIGGKASPGSLEVNDNAVLILKTGNSNSYGSAPTSSTKGNGLIVDGRTNTIMNGKTVALVLDILADKPTVTVNEKVIITTKISEIRDILGDPSGKIELFQGNVKIKELTGITKTNDKISYEFTPTKAGDFKFTAKYVKTNSELYGDISSADLIINVLSSTTPVTNITILPNPAMLQVGKTTTLKAEVTPINATDKTLIWTTGDPSIVTVDTNGVVTGVSAGTTTITATAKDGSGVFNAATITITTNPPVEHKFLEIPSDKNGYTAKVDVNFADFKSVEIDNKALKSTDFKAWSGSTFLKLEKAYLDTLIAGNHTITLIFKDGTATETFTKAKSGTGVTTGGTTGDIGAGFNEIYDIKPWGFDSEIKSKTTIDSDKNPASGEKDMISTTAMFFIFSLVGALIIRKNKIN